MLETPEDWGLAGCPWLFVRVFVKERAVQGPPLSETPRAWAEQRRARLQGDWPTAKTFCI